MIYLTAKLLWFLLVAHLICDYKLQGSELSIAKNRWLNQSNIPWYIPMTAHGLMHGGAVLLITDSLLLSTIEMLSHMTIDHIKAWGKITFAQDQALHIALKMWYAVIAVWLFGWKAI